MIIQIKRMKVSPIIGIHEHEREHRQELYISLSLRVHAPEAPHSDSLRDTLDYQAIHDELFEWIQHSSFHLLETLAKAIIDRLQHYPRVEWMRVEIDKPQALLHAESVSVELEQSV